MKKFGTGSASGSVSRYLSRRALELRTKASRALTDPLGDWACRRIRLEGQPFSFAGHEYLRGIYNDTSAHVVLQKAAQIGGSTWSILRSIHACISGLNVGYFFPTKTDVLDFSRSRVGPLLSDNEFLLELMKDTDTAGLKRIGEAFLYLRGMQSTVSLKSVPIDLLVFDELDEATPEAKAMAKERLAHSNYGRIIELSNPSLPDFGIDEAYQLSDQRHWTSRCDSCNHWTALDREFPSRLNQPVRVILERPDGSCFRACVKCGSELNLAAGEWVAEYPSRKTHGYLISQLISERVDAADILREYRTTRYADHFYNLKIGIAYADLDRRLDMTTVLALCDDTPMMESASEDDYCSMGVDTGRALHVVILKQSRADDTRQHLIHLGTYREFDDLDELMKRYNVSRCVIDGLPETHATRKFAERHHGHVFLSFFNENQKGEPKWERMKSRVETNRTEALDASRDAIRSALVSLPRRDRLVETFARHMCADAKKLEEDEETGAKKYRYIKTGENHFGFAFTYAWLAAAETMIWRRCTQWIFG